MVLQNCRDVKNEVFKKKIAFYVFVFFMLETEKPVKQKKTWKKAQNTYKNRYSLRWSSKNGKSEQMDVLQKLPDTICVRKGENAHFRAHYLF